MKKVTYFGLLLAVALTGLSSCSSSDDVTSDPTNTKSGESRLTLTISTGSNSSATGSAKANMATRATDITADPTASKEQQINHITVAIFSSDGSTVRTIQELTKHTGTGSAAAGDGTYSQTAATATATIVTNSLTATDKIYVVCNAPAGTFQGVQNATDFEAKTEGIDNALATEFGGTSTLASLVDHNIPMYGQGTLTAVSGSDNFTATVTVQHQTAKVTLESLKVDFDQNGPYKDASFEPTGIFLMNVPSTLKFTSAATTGSTTLLQGYDSKTTATYKQYLSTSAISATANTSKVLSGNSAATSTNTFGKTYFFYTMPNSLTDKDKRTKLVIAGTFKANSSDKGSTVYYPVSLNANYDTSGSSTAADKGTKFTVNPNMNYKCTVTIKTKGASLPTTDVTPQQVAITVTVSGFTDAFQTTIFN